MFAVPTLPKTLRYIAAPLAFALSLCAPAGLFAMRVSPMVLEMTTTGSGAAARIELQNLNQTKLPYETHITQLNFAADGHVTETPADDNFLVFPPQGVLLGGARQVIRVQWVGPALDSSRAFYVSIDQLPIPLDPAKPGAPGAQLQIVYHMKALVVVAPPNATPNVTAIEAHAAPYQAKVQAGEAQAAPVPGLSITLKNTGKRHAMMGGLRWIVDGAGKDGKPLQASFTIDQLNQFIGSGYLGPLGATRTYSLPTPTAFGPGPIRVRFVQ